MLSRRIVYTLLPLLLLVSGCGSNSQVDEFLAQTKPQITPPPLSGNSETPTDTVSDDNSLQLLEKTVSLTGSDRKGSVAVYQSYSPSTREDARMAGKTIVLFWHSEQCSTCLALEQEINRSPSRLPSDIRILKISYNSGDALASQYQVSKPNTFIIFNPEGTEIRRISGGIYTIDKLLRQL